ncbi:plasmid transfer protein [Serratia symbiotica]|uniref:plasmid transfer protein n=1 Tax=Serratia symbiotica TaxID=138074 RepID=UPI001887F783|nr:plasmid transfer protein [Serratia symbiotica]MBF1995477.1 plasmid transfer protein [Serratia symbiotica]
MPLSHASPDELLPETPVSQGSYQDVPPVAKRAPRQRLSINMKKITRAGGVTVLAITLIGAVVAFAVMIREISNLTIRVNTLDAAFRSGQIGQLTSNVTAMEIRLNTLEQQVTELAKLPAEVQSNNEAQATLREALQQFRDADTGSRQDVAQVLTRISTLEHDVKQSAVALGEINRQLTQKAVEPEKAKAAPVEKTATPVKKNNRSARRAATPVAPFLLTGIEHRGGQTFAVIIPRGVSEISAMHLLSPGDGLMGWTLRATEGKRAALFMVSGSEHRLLVQ